MRAGRLLLIATLLAGCNVQHPDAIERPGWLIGRWMPVDKDTPFPLACESDAGVIYDADGQFHREGGSGTWRVKAGLLTETMTTVHDPEPETTVEGYSTVLRIRRIDVDRFRIVASDGESMVYRRCPAG